MVDQTTSDKSRKWPRWAGVLMILASFFLPAGTVAYLARPGFHFWDARPTQIGLEVTRTAEGQFSLNWNRNAPLLANAKGAKLTIIDGPVSHELPLDTTELREGKILYRANSPEVQFQLQVYLENKRSITEIVPARSRQMKPPATDPTTSRAASLKAPAGSLNPAGRTESSAKKRPHQLQPRTVDPTRIPVLSTRVSMSAPQPPEKLIYVRPSPIQEIKPDTGLFQRMIRDGARISIRIQMDEAGRVVTAEVRERDADLDSQIVDASLAAARAWLFKPATVNGKPISAGYTIVFEFRGSRRG